MYNCGMGFIFYGHSVVGNNKYCTNTKMGVGKRPDATSGDCEMIQLYEYIIVDKIACDIFRFYILYTQRCWWGCKLFELDIWREDIVIPIVTTYASRYRCVHMCIQL